MYRVMLVDDEEWILRGLQKKFPWKEYGFEVIASFSDSLDAKDYIQHHAVDAVFTDIRMPELSGIDLMKQVTEERPEIKFVFITGFSDFEYAREAIRNNAVDYILKPVEAEQVDEVLNRLKKALEFQKYQILYKKEKESPKDEKSILPSGSNAQRIMQQMTRYIDEHFSENLSLKELAEQNFLSFHYSSELFKKYTGEMFTQYLTRIRMREAEKMLLAKELSIEEIAHQCGYSDYSYFVKVFKKWSNMTPHQYRNRKPNP